MSSPGTLSPTARSPTKGSPTKSRVGAPIDYSFKDLSQITDIVYEEPVGGYLAHPVLPRDANLNEYLDSLLDSGSSTPTSPKPNSISVRVCNNSLTTLKGLDSVMAHLLTDPTELTWLDASCNQLRNIEDVVAKFPKLQLSLGQLKLPNVSTLASSTSFDQGPKATARVCKGLASLMAGFAMDKHVLYLHGNQINSLHDVLHLAKLENLQKLTLHGNPIAEKSQYKLWVCAHLPKLRSLDFSSITKLDRDRVNTWYRGYLKQQEEH